MARGSTHDLNFKNEEGLNCHIFTIFDLHVDDDDEKLNTKQIESLVYGYCDYKHNSQIPVDITRLILLIYSNIDYPTAVEKICAALNRYYCSLNKGDGYKDNQGIGKFTQYCYENGINEDVLFQKLKQDPNENILTEFDHDIPFPVHDTPEDEETRRDYILHLIKECQEVPNISDFRFVFVKPSMSNYIYQQIS